MGTPADCDCLDLYQRLGLSTMKWGRQAAGITIDFIRVQVRVSAVFTGRPIFGRKFSCLTPLAEPMLGREVHESLSYEGRGPVWS